MKGIIMPPLQEILEIIKHVAGLFGDMKKIYEGIQWIASTLISPLLNKLWEKVNVHLIFLPGAVPESSPKIARVHRMIARIPRIIDWLTKAYSIYRVITTIFWLLDFLSKLAQHLI